MAGNIKGITIELNGDTTKLDKALKDVNKTSRDLNKELREIDKSLKFNPGNTELLTQKQRALATAVENTKKKLDTLKNAQKQAAQALAEGKIGQDQYDALTREILKTENQLKSLEGQLAKVNSSWAQAGEKMQDVGGKMQEVGKGITDVGQDLTTKLTVPLAAIGVASAKMAIDFESAFAGVKKTVDATDEEFAKMEQGIRDMAKELPATAVEIAAVAEAAGQLGIENENILTFTRTMIDLGEATNMTADQAATAFAQFANITQMPQSEFDKLGSTVVELGNNLATTEADIVSMGMRLAGTGSQVGLTQAEIMGLAAAMSSVGINAEAGGSAFSRVMQKINSEVLSSGENLQGFAEVAGMSAEQFASLWQEKPTAAIEAFVAGLGLINEAGGDVTATLKALGINSLQELDTLLRLSGAGDLLAYSFDLANEAWEENIALTEEAEQRYSTTESQLAILKNNLTDIGITLGQILVPMLKQFSTELIELANSFAQLNPSTQEMIVKIGLFAAAIGPVVTAIGMLVTVLGGIISAAGGVISFFAAGGAGAAVLGAAATALGVSIGSLVAIFAGVVAAGAVIITNWDNIKTSASELWESITTKFSEGAAKLKENWEQIKENAIQSNEEMKAKLEAIWEGIKTAISTAWQNIKTQAQSDWNAIKSTLEGIWNNIKTSATTSFNAMKSAIDTAWNAIKSSTNSIWNGIKSSLTSIWNGLKSTLDTTWNSIKSATTNTWNTVKSTITNAINAARDAVNNAINRIKSILSITLPFPKIKLPHFRISGSFSLNPPRVPSFGVDWYDKGGIFSSPSIIGVGEKRPEFVGALDDLREIVADVINKEGGTGRGDVLITGNTFNVRNDNDIKRIAEEIYKMQHKNSRGKGLVVS